MPPRSNNWDSFNFALAVGVDEYVHAARSSWVGQLQCYSELSYVSAKLYRSSVDWRWIVQGAICRGLRLCITCKNATSIELHIHTYAVGVLWHVACRYSMPAREGSPHNVLHSSSLLVHCVHNPHQLPVLLQWMWLVWAHPLLVSILAGLLHLNKIRMESSLLTISLMSPVEGTLWWTPHQVQHSLLNCLN